MTMPSTQALCGFALLVAGLQAERLACLRWRFAQHQHEIDIRVVLAFALPIAGVLLMAAS
jgi:hypothetical protein